MATEAEMALALHNALISDPKTRKQTLKLIKQKFPDATIPEIDAAAPVETELGELRKMVTDLTATIKNEREDAKIAGRFDTLKSSRGYTDEGLQGIQKLMVEKSIADPEAAADHYDRINYKPEPIQPMAYSGSRAFNTPDSDAMKGWLENPDNMVDSIIGEVLTESRSGRLVG